MYQQINATEMFRERQLALRREAENRRLARRLRVARRSGLEKANGRLRGTALLFAAVVLMLLISATAALAEIKVGTNNSETLTGTNAGDNITGAGGNDILKGLARNDVYHFDSGFGQDTLTETATVKVGKKKLPGGTDTLSFSQHGTALIIQMIPQWGASRNRVDAPGTTDSVDLGTSPVERVVGGSGSDGISGGSATNTYEGGPGSGADTLRDHGGDDGSGVGSAVLPDLPASNDTYKGFTSGTGFDAVFDYGGTADKLDLRPLESSDVSFNRFDSDSNGSSESLRILISGTSRVDVHGHFAAVEGTCCIFPLKNGRMEQIIFADETVTSATELNSLM